MRVFNECVFDDVIHGAATAYTGEQFVELLGSTDKLVIQVLAWEPASAQTRLSLQIETSLDGIHWLAKAATPEIASLALTPGQTTIGVGVDTGAIPSDGIVRLAISLTDPMLTPAATVRVFVTGRDDRHVDPKDCPCAGEFAEGRRAAAEPTEEEADRELLRQTLDDLLVSEGDPIGPDVRMELEWARTLVTNLPEAEQAQAVLDALSPEAEGALTPVLVRVHDELAQSAKTLVDAAPGERPPSGRVHRWVFEHRMRELALAEGPPLDPEAQPQFDELVETAPPGTDRERSGYVLSRMAPEDVAKLIERMRLCAEEPVR